LSTSAWNKDEVAFGKMKLLCIFRGRIASLPETGCCGTSGTAAPPDEEAAAEHGPFPIEQLQV